jgi:hypothetical protein
MDVGRVELDGCVLVRGLCFGFSGVGSLSCISGADSSPGLSDADCRVDVSAVGDLSLISGVGSLPGMPVADTISSLIFSFEFLYRSRMAISLIIVDVT